ncbi:uncharacterized protein LOC124118569 isoform X3 [Haliotis rufescens]|uniref:uncharacterized protein LOC124118569 isoform X3 n=1 Tax=Haliotis rufescens TaxID=6454 RepID=UPI00201F9472|nr:uncharacterized protein LOC124118569 isoform X3 [Haliotis rufescens]
MWRLLQNIAKEDEHGLYLGTNDFFRPGLKQIGNSLYDIRSYFIQKDGQDIAPTKLTTSLEQVKERLIEHVENHAFDFVFDHLTNEVVDFPNPKAGPCFMFLAHSLSEVLDFPTSPRPSHTVCDVFLALPTQPVIVLSLVDGDAESPEAVMYNTSVARGVIETLSRFTDEDVNSIHGVIHTSVLGDAASFETRLKKLANDSSHFVTRDSLVMTPGRYEQVLTGFWAGVAETKSVLKETGDTDGDCLRFLTKEQCIILVENINDKDVQVKCVPGSGATTLMLEVARRLNRQGDTLLVCRSREERDRLRSVYPSAVAAEDLSMVDLSSCVNIVDETNTVMTHASGRNWRFAQICEAEREKEVMKKQIDVLSDGSMWKLLQNIAKEDEHGLYLGTNDLFRPDLKQIGDSLYEIKSYFIQKDGQNIVPSDLRTPLAQVKERLIEHIENHAFDFVFDPLTSEVVDFPNPKAGPCFMFLAHSLSVVLDFPTSPRPSHTVCDVFLALPTQPVIVLSLVDGDAESPEAVMYNTSVARGVIETLSRFTDEDVNSIHGVIHTSILEDAASFETRLKKLANDSSHFVTRDSLVMTPGRYEQVLTTFWAGVAETKSVLKETGDTDGDCLRFLTKEQFVILVENINDKDVQVKCVPGSGATTLMLEVARRLNRQGDTLLVCRSREERDRLRSVYPSAVAAEDLSTVDLSSCVTIVDETNTVMTHASSRKWRFGTYVTDIKQLTSQIREAEREKEGIEKQIDVLSDDAWKKQIEYLLRDFGVLKIFSYKLGQTGRMTVHQLQHSLEDKPHGLTTSKGHYESLGGCRLLSVTHEAQLSDLHDGMRQQKNMFPLLRSVMIKDKTLQMYHEVKMAHLRKALGPKEYTESKQNFTMFVHVESPGIEQQMGRVYIESRNAGKESNIQPVLKEGSQTTELEMEVQETDGKDLESRSGELDMLNQDLDNLLKDRDQRKKQLHKLFTVEWQATMKYLTRHTSVLSSLDMEIPGFEVGAPDRQETTITGRVPAVPALPALSTEGYDESGEQTGPSKSKKRRLHIDGSVTSQSDHTCDGRDHNKEQESQRHTRAPVLIHQLRQYQQGRLTENHLADIAMKIIRENEQQLTELKAKNDSLEKGPKRHLDAARANTDVCHVTTDGELVNSSRYTRDEGRNRLQEYVGTCSSPIPLPPPPSTLTLLPTTPTYWETKTRVRVVRGVPWNVLEMGVCQAGQVDTGLWVSLQRRSWCVRVERYGSHGRSLCTAVYREGERGECHQNTMSRTPGTQATLHYGVVLDVGRGRVAFIDLDRGIVLVKYDEVFREPLVPMFSAGMAFACYTAAMSLISGGDVDMTDAKRALVYQALR